MKLFHRQSEPIKGYFAILFATFLYGWFGVLVKLIGSDIPIFYQTFARNAVMALILLLFLTGAKINIFAVQRKDMYKIIARSTFGLINISAALIAFQHLSIGLAYILFFAGLLLGSFLIGTIINGEKLTKMKVISLALTMSGVMLAYAYRTQVSGEILYVTLAIISGVCVAFWNIIAQHIRHEISAATLNFFDAVLLTIFSGAASLLVQEARVLPSLSIAWIANVLMMGTFIFAGILIPYGFRKVEAHVGSILMPLEIVFGVLFGVLIFQESLRISLVVGCACIILASILPYVWELRGNRHIHTR